MYDQYPIVLAVAAFIKNAEGRILIVKKSPEEQIDAGLWTVPGGKVKPDEPIIKALKREIVEEVGLKIVNYEWIGEDVFTSNNRYFHAQHFLCSTQSVELITLEKNLLEYTWVDQSQIDLFEFPAKIKKRLMKIL